MHHVWIEACGPQPAPLVHPTPVPFSTACSFFAVTGVGAHARAIDTVTGEDVTTSALVVTGHATHTPAPAEPVLLIGSL